MVGVFCFDDLALRMSLINFCDLNVSILVYCVASICEYKSGKFGLSHFYSKINVIYS